MDLESLGGDPGHVVTHQDGLPDLEDDLVELVLRHEGQRRNRNGPEFDVDGTLKSNMVASKGHRLQLRCQGPYLLIG